MSYLCSYVTNLIEEKSRCWYTLPSVYNNFTTWMCLFQDKPPICGSPRIALWLNCLCHLFCPVRCPHSPDSSAWSLGLTFSSSQQMWTSNFLFQNFLKNVAEDRAGARNDSYLEWLQDNTLLFQFSLCLSRSPASGSSFGSFTRYIHFLQLL